MVVSIVNEGVALIRMRPSRKRRAFDYPVDAIYLLAVRAHVAQLRREKEAKRKARRAEKKNRR